MTTLQIIWFLLICILLTGYAILDGFDLGVGLWHLFSKDEKERQLFLKAIGPFWDGNEVWLLTGGGALFAAFAPVYATTFSGFYLAMILVLVGLIFRAVAVELRLKEEGECWRSFWDKAFAFGSFLPSLLFGVALGNVLRGMHLDDAGNYTAGFFALLNPYALLCGVLGLMMFATHGALFLAVKTEGELNKKVRSWVFKAALIYGFLLVAVIVWTLASHYYYGTLILPLSTGFLAFLSVVLLFAFLKKGQDYKAFLASCASILFVMGTFASALFPLMVPNSLDLAKSLTVFNSSSSEKTLTVMLVLALIGMPIVLTYTTFIYRTFRGKLKV